MASELMLLTKHNLPGPQYDLCLMTYELCYLSSFYLRLLMPIKICESQIPLDAMQNAEFRLTRRAKGKEFRFFNTKKLDGEKV